ncbi:MAG: HAD family phosphatase [bacterium]|nr:HAD family phosphatase [bacterium]
MTTEHTEDNSPEKVGNSPTFLFDLGGVIVKNGFWDWVNSQTEDEAQKEAYRTVIDAADAGSITEEECMQKLGELSHRPSTQVSEELTAAYAPHEEVVEILQELKERKYPLVLVTNFMQGRANSLLDTHDLRKYFDRVFISSEMGLAKPSPEFFRQVNKDLGVRPADEIFIDDSARNIEVGLQEGIQGSLLYTNPNDLRAKLEERRVLPPAQPSKDQR